MLKESSYTSLIFSMTTVSLCTISAIICTTPVMISSTFFKPENKILPHSFHYIPRILKAWSQFIYLLVKTCSQHYFSYLQDDNLPNHYSWEKPVLDLSYKNLPTFTHKKIWSVEAWGQLSSENIDLFNIH